MKLELVVILALSGCAHLAQVWDKDSAELEGLEGVLHRKDVSKEYKTTKEDIGKGMFATIYRGHPIDDSTKPVAVKVSKLQDLEEKNRARAYREIRILDALRNRRIVSMEKAFLFNQKLSIVLEYIDGGTLEQFSCHTENETMPLGLIPGIMRQVCEALRFVHSRHALHRDIKLENIMLSSTSGIKLIDFGLATKPRLTQKLHKRGCGSPLFAAPEFYYGKKYDSSVDIYSFGISMLFLYTNPFIGSDSMNSDDFIAKLSENKGPWGVDDQSVPAEVLVVLKRCCAWEAKTRPSAEALLGMEILKNGADDLSIRQFVAGQIAKKVANKSSD